MKTTTLLLGIALLALLLAGCSGSGKPAAEASCATIRTTATDHLSTMSLLMGWLKTLYFIVPPSDGPTTTVVETLPDGTYHFAGNNSDGSSFEYWVAPDGSGHGTETWPGMSVTFTYGVPVWDDTWTHLTQDSTQEWSTGLTLTMLIEVDFSVVGTPQTWSGEATITGPAAVTADTTMQYTLVRHSGYEDHLTLQLPDGCTLEFTTPVTAVAGSSYWPLFTQGATATYTGPAGTLTYELTGAGDTWWDHVTFTGEDGFAGDFSVDGSFVGSGQVMQNGSTAAALSWNAAATGQLSLVGAGSEEVSASAAARAFRLDQWTNHAAMLGPMPMY